MRRLPPVPTAHCLQLFLAVSYLLKHGAQVSQACKQGVPGCEPGAGDEPPVWGHEVALLAHRVATRTLALLLKSKSAGATCTARLNEYHTQLAGALSNRVRSRVGRRMYPLQVANPWRARATHTIH